MLALRFNPEGHGTTGNDEVVFSPSLSVALGSTTIDWMFEFRVKLDALPTVAGTYYFIGSDTTATEGIYLRFNAGVYTLAFSVSSALRFQSSANMILADGEFHTYKISRVRNQASVVFERDGVPFGTPATQANGTAVMDLNRFGRGATNTTNFTAFEMDYFICSTSAPLYAEWRADLSNGSGNELLTTDNSRNGTLTNFTTVDADKWINYGSIPEYTVNITGTYAGYTASVIADATEPVFTASVAASYASYIAAVNSTNTKPVKTASIVSTYPSYTASISATGGNVTYISSINATYPKYTANVAVADVNKLSISTSYPAYTSNVISTNTKPVKTASVVSTYAQYSASVVATKVSVNKTVSINTTYPVYSVNSVLTNVDPIRSVSINTTYPNYGATCTLTNVDPVNGVSINSTYPKYSALVNAGTLIQDKTVSINSSYPTYVAAVVIGDFVSLPYIGGKGAHLVISLGSRDVIIKDKSRNVKWRVENARL